MQPKALEKRKRKADEDLMRLRHEWELAQADAERRKKILDEKREERAALEFVEADCSATESSVDEADGTDDSATEPDSN